MQTRYNVLLERWKESHSRTLTMDVALHLPTQEVDYDAMEADYDDDANGMMENDLNYKIDCHVKLVPNYKK